MNDIVQIMKAADFAARKHTHQRLLIPGEAAHQNEMMSPVVTE